MLSHEEGVMNILRYEPYDERHASTPESFVFRPVVRGVFTHTSYSVALGNHRWASYFVDVKPGTRLPLMVTLA